jgi:hypothetical protein
VAGARRAQYKVSNAPNPNPRFASKNDPSDGAETGGAEPQDVFLAEMAAAVPWSVLEADRAAFPKEGPQGGRRPFPIAVMLRIYCLQQWYNLSDPGAEEALYDIQSMRARNSNAIRSRMRRRS